MVVGMATDVNRGEHPPTNSQQNAKMNLFWKLKNSENSLAAARIRNEQLLHENRLLKEKLAELEGGNKNL